MFQDFIDPENSVARLLIGRFLYIEIILVPVLEREYVGRTRATPDRGYLNWISVLHRDSPLHLRKYLQWSMTVKDYFRVEIEEPKKLIPTVSIMRREDGLSEAVF